MCTEETMAQRLLEGSEVDIGSSGKMEYTTPSREVEHDQGNLYAGDGRQGRSEQQHQRSENGIMWKKNSVTDIRSGFGGSWKRLLNVPVDGWRREDSEDAMVGDAARRLSANDIMHLVLHSGSRTLRAWGKENARPVGFPWLSYAAPTAARRLTPLH